MLELARTVRFCVGRHQHTLGGSPPRGCYNGYGGWPAMDSLGAYYELVVTCRGTSDRITGYLTNISKIDAAVRDTAIPLVAAAYRGTTEAEPGHVLGEIVAAMQKRLDGLVASVQWRLTPYYWLSMHTDSQDSALMSQQFEFSAAHRLHCAQLGDNRSREVFGRCNNPNGHGHNYRLQVTVAVPLDGSGFGLGRLEQIVMTHIIDRFDHTHLNLDTAEFAQLNPTVEHIAKVCHDLLLGPLADAGASLECVTVWETEKTSCTYPAGR